MYYARRSSPRSLMICALRSHRLKLLPLACCRRKCSGMRKHGAVSPCPSKGKPTGSIAWWRTCWICRASKVVRSNPREWYPIDELVHDVLGHMQPVLDGRTVHTDLPADLPPVELDYLEIDQVLTNLIENAVRIRQPDHLLNLVRG